MRPPLLPVLSGLLLLLSFPPFPLGPLSFAALVPLAVWVGERSADAWGAEQALRGGLWMGVVLFAGLLHWIAFSLPDRLWLGAASFLTVVAILALFPALAARLCHAGLRRGVPLWLALPVAWTATEWLRGILPGGFAFPWAGLALSLTFIPRTLGPAAWVGEQGVTFWIALVNGLLAAAVLQARRGYRRGLGCQAAAALVAIAPPVLFATLGRAPPGSEGSAVRVALVQTAVPQRIREDPVAGADAMAAALDRVLPRVAPGAADVIVLPETAFPVALESPSGQIYLELLENHARRLEAPILVGAFGVDSSVDVAGGAVFNSVFVIDEEEIGGRYDKRHLVPGVERTPLIPAALRPALGDTASYSVGRPRRLVISGSWGDVSLGPLICYESAFGSLARAHARAGAQLLVNVTNDAWFGMGRPGVVARAQHEAHLVLRAIESQIPVVRSANGGVAMVVEPSGVARAVAPAGEEGVGVVAVTPSGGSPSRWRLTVAGLVGPLCAASVLIVWVVGGRRRSAFDG